MKECKRRQQRQEKRHKRSIEKHELDSRIRKLREKVVAGLMLCSTLEFVSAACLEPKSVGHKHRKLSLQERQYIYLYRERGYGIREIGRRLARAASTISRELRRNRPPAKLLGYCPYSQAKYAHDRARERSSRTRIRVRFGSGIIQSFVYEAIKNGASPRLASNRLFLEHGIKLSHEAIYQWIYKVERGLIKHLLRGGKAINEAARNAAEQSVQFRLIN